MKRIKRTYHPLVILLYQMKLLPSEIAREIPRSTKYDHKKYDLTKQYGHELANQLNETMKLFEMVVKLKQKFNKLKEIIRLKNVKIFFLKHMENLSISTLRLKEKAVRSIQKALSILDLKTVLKQLSISKETYFRWKKQIKENCIDSLIKKCFKRHPNQLTIKEVKKIKDLCSQEEFKYWPFASIYWYGVRVLGLFMHISTFYKYVKKLGLKKIRILSRRKKYKEGIRANLPNQIWQIDVTEFRTNDNTKVYIYLIIDNCSRFILDYRISTKLSGRIRKESIQSAYDHYLRINQKKGEATKIIVDGGPENNNKTVNEFLSQNDVHLTKLIAQKDIDFSNSMIEAFNKKIKYQWLYHKPIQTINDLENYLDEYIQNYNYERFNHQINGLTPYEAYTGHQFNKNEYSQNIEKAKQERIAFNQQYTCEIHN